MNLETYIAFTKRWEGGLSRDPKDSASAYPCPTAYGGKTGYHTNVGITYKVWVSVFGKNNDARFFAMSSEDWFNVFKTLYWNSMRGDEFQSFSVAVLAVGMCWGSGKKAAVKLLQKAIVKCGVSVVVDGLLGNATMNAANSIEARKLFDAIADEREAFFRYIGRAGTDNNKFLKGWLNRLADYRKTFRP